MKNTMVIVCTVLLSGCATTVRYTSFSQEKLASKPKNHFIAVYPASQKLSADQPYTVIGQVEVSGNASDGVSPRYLEEKATAIARKKGADAIINAKTENYRYNDVYVVPGHMSYRPAYHYHRRHHAAVYVPRYRPTRYYPTSDVLMTFRGDLVSMRQDVLQ